MTAIPNIHRAITTQCGKDDIAIIVSGDDELLGRLVFKVINVVYQTKKPGVAYTNHFLETCITTTLTRVTQVPILSER